MLKATGSALAAFSGLMLAAQFAHAGADPTGVWLNDTGRGAIEIAPCGDNLCGHVVWLKDTSDAKGCGKQIIGDAKSVGGGRWDNGWIYSPERKRNFDVELKRLDNGNLRVMGYAGAKFLSKTMIWTPAPADLQRCSTVEAKAAPAAADTAKVEAPVATDVAKADASPPAETSDAAKPSSPETKAETSAPSAPAAKQAAAAAPEASAPDAQASRDEGRSNKAKTAAKNNDADTDAASASDRKNLKIGGLDLDKVLSRKNGKCKLDLPWVKVKFDCND